jgi:nicotinamide phosphoribosyltransferase
MFRPTSLYYTDGYKIGHKAMLAEGTDFLYGTWIPRSTKHAPKGINKIVSFGQQLTWRWIHDEFTENFFNKPVEEAISFVEDMCMYLGMEFNGDHFIALHKLGYLPIRAKALPEGIETRPNVPHMTFVNTKKGYAWLTLFLETIVSSLAWKPATSATIALKYNRNLYEWVLKTDPTNAWLIPFLAHDFSARGIDPWTMVSSGLGHATSFRGSDTIVVIPAARYFYGEPKNEVCINSVNASEHSVSTTKIFTVGEKQMLIDWMNKFDKGILSVVMDTFDITKVAKPSEGGYCFDLKDQILSRDGKLVIRPDSGDPVEIICGHGRTELTDNENRAFYPEFYTKGLIECLWDIFGGTINEQGYKVLDTHIGAIYGDSITTDRQVEIYERLAEKGFAATNIVLGVGSYTYQYNTRDTFGFAAKGAWFEENGVQHDIYKDPISDDGTKKSLKGLISVHETEDGDHSVGVQCTFDEEKEGILQVIYEDGKFYNETTLTEIRGKIEALTKSGTETVLA